MSLEQPNDDATVDKMLERLLTVRFDTLFVGMLDKLRETQAEIDALVNPEWGDIRDKMHELDMMWEVSGWNATSVSVNGKVRLSGDFNGIVDAFDTSGMEKGHDDQGDFYIIKDKKLACLGFRIDELPDKELDEYHTIVLALTPPETLDDESDADSCLFALHPDDIDSIEFDEKSSTGIEANLRYYFPGILDYIEKSIPEGCYSDRDVTLSLKRLAVRCDNPDFHGFDLLKALNTYLYGRIDFDTVGYQIDFDGPILGLANVDEFIKIEHDRKFSKIPIGYICGIKMEESEGESSVYRPSLVVAVPSPDGHADYEAYVVPAESLLRVRNLRPSRSLMGKTASLGFNYIEDVEAYFSGKRMELMGQMSDDEIFANIVAQVGENLHDTMVYDATHGYCRASIRGDIKQILDTYDKATADLRGSKTDIPDSTYALLCETMLKSAASLQSLRIGDELVTHGATVVIDTDGGEQESLVLTSDESIEGRFCGFAVSEVPDIAMAITSGEAGGTSHDITILVDNVRHTDSEGDVHTDTFHAQEVAIVLSRDSVPTIFKILRNLDAN